MNGKLCLALALLALSAVALPGQNMPTCTVNTDTVTPSCPTSAGWLAGVTCAHRRISCPTVNGVAIDDLGITFGYKTPSSPVGTIVFFSYDGGTTPANFVGAEPAYARLSTTTKASK